MLRRTFALCAVALAVVAGVYAADSDPSKGLTEGDITLKSAGPLAFGPAGILFVADPMAATVYAIDTGDNKATESSDRPNVAGIDEKVGSMLGAKLKAENFKAVAVNPISGNAYLSVSRGTGPKASPVILKVTRKGDISEVSLTKVRSAKATIPNAADKEKSRAQAITDMTFYKGRLLIAGLSNEEFASNLRSIPYPFDKTDRGSSIEIWHAAHNKIETHSPIRVFTPYATGGEEYILASYTCTPLVRMPIKDLEPGKKIKAVTVAELGNRNQPLSIIVYNKGGKDFALMSNSARGVMKISLEGVDKAEAITTAVKGGGTAGQKYETIKDLTGVQKLDAYGKEHALVLAKSGDKLDLKTIELP
jgi:hypothetical protein